MITFLVAVQIVIAVALVGVILMQRSEGGGFGTGGSPGGLVSARGAADFMTRATAVLAGLFILLSIVLAGLVAHSRAATTLDTSLSKAAPVAATAPANGAAQAPGNPNDPLSAIAAPGAPGTTPAGIAPLALPGAPVQQVQHSVQPAGGAPSGTGHAQTEVAPQPVPTTHHRRSADTATNGETNTSARQPMVRAPSLDATLPQNSGSSPSVAPKTVQGPPAPADAPAGNSAK